MFCVSILGDHDIYHFPLPFPLEKRLKDILEPEVDDKYVLSDTAIEGFLKHNLNHLAKGTGFLFKPKEIDLPEGGQGSELPESQFGFMPNGQYHQRTNTTVSDTLQARPGGGATDMYIRQRKWKGK